MQMIYTSTMWMILRLIINKQGGLIMEHIDKNIIGSVHVEINGQEIAEFTRHSFFEVLENFIEDRF